jgi:hypothetical protein
MGVFWREVEVIPGGSALGGPNGNRKRCPRQEEKECTMLLSRVRWLRGKNPPEAEFINYFV